MFVTTMQLDSACKDGSCMQSPF